MSSDQILVIGMIILVLSLPSIAGAYAENRAPRAAAIIVLIGGVLIAVALTQKPNGYTFADIPHVFMRVIADVIN